MTTKKSIKPGRTERAEHASEMKRTERAEQASEMKRSDVSIQVPTDVPTTARTAPITQPSASMPVAAPHGSGAQATPESNGLSPMALTQSSKNMVKDLFSFLGDLKEVIEFFAIIYSAITLAVQVDKQVIFFFNVFFRNGWISFVILVCLLILFAYATWKIRNMLGFAE